MAERLILSPPRNVERNSLTGMVPTSHFFDSSQSLGYRAVSFRLKLYVSPLVSVTVMAAKGVLRTPAPVLVAFRVRGACDPVGGGEGAV